MDFTNRGNKPHQSSHPVVSGATNPGMHEPKSNGEEGFLSGKLKHSRAGEMRKTSVFLLFSATILLVTLLLFIFFGGHVRTQNRFVNKNEYQAVFMNGGQVYFGKIIEQNERYLRLEDIYYLRESKQVQPDQKDQKASDLALIKLGCEVHGPEDQMIINPKEINFWENLRSNGKVTEAINEYKKAHPGTMTCETTTSQTQQAPATPAKKQ